MFSHRDNYPSQETRMKAKLMETINPIIKTGKDDPRRIVHSMKVGLALTLASLFYYFRPLYYGLGESAMWAILTVVVVFEFTVGGTLSKSLNRGGATLLAVSLGVGAEYLATLGGEKGEPIILGILVFIATTTSTFMRFMPNVKSRYDYGMLIFILTFSLVAVSGYRVDKIMDFAHQRLATILIGGATCILVSISISPVWAGQDLHNLVARNITNLAAFLDGFGGEFFNFPGDGDNALANEDMSKAFLVGYKSVLNSKAIEEALANFAWWEPPHGKFRDRQLWKHYLKIGILTRECARQLETLGECIKSKPKEASEFHKKIKEPCIRMSIESSKALMQLSSSLKNMRIPSPEAKIHIQNSRDATDDLKTVLESFSLHDNRLQQIMQLFVVSSTLMDIIESTEKLSKCVNELCLKAHFKNVTLTTEQEMQPHHIFPKDQKEKESCVVITINVHESSNKREIDK